jgi:uncharacterized membrane protein
VDPGPGEQAERSRDFERFLTFADAVVAIAMTLLVLPLVDVAGELALPGHDHSVVHLLQDHQAQLYAFLLSFAVIANLWFTQHQVIRPVAVHDALVTRLMVVWLLMIVFLPFPTALVAEQGQQPVTKALYIGTMTLSSVVMALMAQRIRFTPAVRDSDDAIDPTGSWVSAALFALALALSLAVPAIGYYALLLLLLIGPLTRGLRRLRGRQPHAGRVGQ